MLVLSRKENETIEFPALGVSIRVFGLSRRRVQLGIDAPVSLKVARGEKRESDRAQAVPPDSLESIAEHVIEEELDRLESELAALAELAGASELELARQVASDASGRLDRIHRTVKAALRRREKMLLDQLDEINGRDCDEDDDALQPCLREAPTEYGVCVA